MPPVPECFDDYRATVMQSLVNCMSNLLPLAHRFETASAEGKEVHRTETEREALQLLYSFLLRFGVEEALDCEILSLWLEKYPFGGNLETKYPGDKDSQLRARHGRICSLGFGPSHNHDPAMFRVLNLILTNNHAKETLLRRESSGGSRSCSNHHDGNPDGDEQGSAEVWDQVYRTLYSPEMGLGPMMRRGQRVREESIEEQTLRRRRREAMVVGEMGRPIESGDSFQQVGT
ncbi:MAG: hypothetical protein Q9168_003351 [Polycauliona sp. 1 TL-2023]